MFARGYSSLTVDVAVDIDDSVEGGSATVLRRVARTRRCTGRIAVTVGVNVLVATVRVTAETPITILQQRQQVNVS